MDQRVAPLLARLDEFVAFARARVGDPHLAADAVQDALLKALAKIDQLADEERIEAWFYRILRHAIVDLQRTRAQRHDDEEPLADPEAIAAAAADHRTACACVAALIDDLPEPYASALRRVDLHGESMAAVAAAEGISMGNLKVRRHRARAELRSLVQAACRVCAAHGCLDCTCGRGGGRTHAHP